MNWEEAKQQALKLGFTLEERTWIPDGYVEDKDGNDTRKLITEPITMLKITYPSDYPHPFGMIDIGETKGLQFEIGRAHV